MAARVDLDGWPGSLGAGIDDDAPVGVVEDLMGLVWGHADRVARAQARAGLCPGEVPLPAAPAGVGDFAEVAWIVAQALGNGPGVRGLDVHRGETGTLYAYVRASNPSFVRGVAAAFGWSLYDPDGHYVNASGRLGELRVSVSFVPTDVA